jgi:outer membrane receptor protein involved in Fe transport
MKRSIFSLLAVCLFAAGVQAQTSVSGINGAVTDPNGTAVKGARVSVRRDATIIAVTTTDEGGRFSIGNLTNDEYRVVVTATGFAQHAEMLQLSGSRDLEIKLSNPQSVSVIPRQLISDRQVLRLAETADNVAGVRPLPGYGGISSIGYIYRGFRPGFTNGSLRNGFREFTFLSARDVQNVERAEFLKGPASLMYGSGEVGGVINTITKKPRSDHHYD